MSRYVEIEMSFQAGWNSKLNAATFYRIYAPPCSRSMPQNGAALWIVWKRKFLPHVKREDQNEVTIFDS